jgi:hypothetical protein
LRGARNGGRQGRARCAEDMGSAEGSGSDLVELLVYALGVDEGERIMCQDWPTTARATQLICTAICACNGTVCPPRFTC